MKKILLFLLLPLCLNASTIGGGGNTLGLSCSANQVPKWSGSGFSVCATLSGTGNVTDINSDSTASQVLTTDGTGTDVGWSDAAGTHTLHLPSASATARGLVTTGTQTFAGTKTFSSTITGSISGNAGTATALAADPADCGANTYATAIAASGALTCGSVTNASTTASASAGNSTIVMRDGSGNFAAGTITANLTGNASGTAATFTGNLTGAVTSTGMATSQIDDRGVIIQTPAAATIPIGFFSFGGTYNAARVKCEAGTLTAKFQTCSGGSCSDLTSCNSLGVTTGASTFTCGASTFVAGDYAQVVVSSPSNASYCQLGLKFTR